MSYFAEFNIESVLDGSECRSSFICAAVVACHDVEYAVECTNYSKARTATQLDPPEAAEFELWPDANDLASTVMRHMVATLPLWLVVPNANDCPSQTDRDACFIDMLAAQDAIDAAAQAEIERITQEVHDDRTEEPDEPAYIDDEKWVRTEGGNNG